MGLQTIIVLTLFHLVINPTSSLDACNTSMSLLEDIDVVVGFLTNHYWQFNLDGWFGYRLLQDFLSVILKGYPSDRCGLTEDMEQVHRKLTTMNEAALHFARLLNPNYVRNLMPFLNKFIHFKSDWRHLHIKNYNQSMSIRNDYDEPEGDKCFRELAGRGCNITRKCSQMFTADDSTSKYVATHKGMYLAVYKQMKCHTQPHPILSKGHLDARINSLCVSMFRENEELLRQPTKEIAKRLDEVFERILICGAKFGFVDFFTPEVLDVLRRSIDHNYGCIRWEAYLANNIMKIKNKNNNVSTNTISLSKRRELFMEGGCSNHQIGTGAAAMGSFMYYALTFRKE